MYNDPSGEFPWLIVIIITGAAIIGGYIGYNYNDKMGSTVTEKDLYADAGVPYPDHIRDAENSDQQTDEELSTTDRVKNTIIGASAGLAIGGVLVSAAGVIGSVAVGSATSTIPIFGATGLQTFAIGALAYDFVAMVIAPFFGIEMEPIEYEP